MVYIPHMGGGIYHIDRTGHIGHVVSVVFHMWVVGYGMVIGLHILDIKLMLCYSHVMVGSSTVIGLDIKDMRSMLFFALLVRGIYYIVKRVDVRDMWSLVCVPTLGGSN